jgi:hypothetical protein
MPSAVHVSHEAGVVVRVVARGPFSVGTKLWRDAHGQLICTVVAKASYALGAGESKPLDEPLPLEEHEAHAKDDLRSARLPSDFAPFKRKAEVVLVGRAVARLVVGGIDQSIEAFPQRSDAIEGGKAPGENGAPDPTRGFGPISSTGPSRAGLLGSHDRAWLRQPSAGPMPAAFPPNFFQVAPKAQWMDRPITSKDTLLIEGLSAEAPRIETRLCGPEPQAVVGSDTPVLVRLRGDLLSIDTERRLCSLTFRGHFPVTGHGARVVVAGVPAETELSVDAMRALLDDDADDLETTHVGDTSDQTPLATPNGFDPPNSVRAALPFRAEPPPPISMSARAPDSAPGIAPPALAAAYDFEMVTPAIFSRTPDPPLEANPAADASANPPSASFGAAFGGVKSASDAAARASTPEALRDATTRSFADYVPEALAQRRAVVSLVDFDPAIVPRLRRMKRFAAALQPRVRTKRAQSADTPHQEPRDERSEVLRALSFARPDDAAEVRRALADSLDDPDELDRPLVLVTGELRPTFDELETLGATVAVVKQVAGADKKVLASLALGESALSAPIAPPPKTALGLARQIEQAASSLQLPPRYVSIEAERVLLEGRKYKRRTILGAPRVLAELQLPNGGGAPMTMYLSDAAATSLPLLVAFSAIALCEVIAREDFAETQEEALLAVAFGRVLRSRVTK